MIEGVKKAGLGPAFLCNSVQLSDNQSLHVRGRGIFEGFPIFNCALWGSGVLTDF